MDMVTLPITLVTAGGAAIINFWLAMRVGKARQASGVSIGDGGDQRLIARMRAQANFVEYTPIVLILMGLVEMAHGTSAWLWAIGAIYILARIAHALGITLHIELLYGQNNHHIVEGIYKGFARAMRQAVERDPRKGDAVPSTKGQLGG